MANMMTGAQRRMIFKLKGENGLDDELFRTFMYSKVKKSSTKDLTIAEAIKIIDALSPTKSNVPDRITTKQQKYIEGLAKQYGWVGENNKTDMLRLNGWLAKRYGVNSIIWLTPKNASDAIEGLKAMIRRGSAECSA